MKTSEEEMLQTPGVRMPSPNMCTFLISSMKHICIQTFARDCFRISTLPILWKLSIKLGTKFVSRKYCWLALTPSTFRNPSVSSTSKIVSTLCRNCGKGCFATWQIEMPQLIYHLLFTPTNTREAISLSVKTITYPNLFLLLRDLGNLKIHGNPNPRSWQFENT